MTGWFATKIGENVHGIHPDDPMEAENYPIRLSSIMVTSRPKISDPRAEKAGIPRTGGSRPADREMKPGNSSLFIHLFLPRVVFFAK